MELFDVSDIFMDFWIGDKMGGFGNWGFSFFNLTNDSSTVVFVLLLQNE